MDESDYPSLYIAANEASLEAQRRSLNLYRFHGAVLLLVAILSIPALQNKSLAVVVGAALLLGTIVSVIMLRDNSQESWYRARALAESVKTSTWRYMTRAAPFTAEDTVANVDEVFISRLKALLSEHRALGDVLGGRDSTGSQITDRMRAVRQSSLEERKEFYLNGRVVEQLNWYKKKARGNRISGNAWGFTIVGIHIVAMMLIYFRTSSNFPGYFPVELFVVGASVALGWVQLKRYKELASAYGLTEQEIGFVQEEGRSVAKEGEFAQFVDDGENAFSREHTQWLARKDTA